MASPKLVEVTWVDAIGSLEWPLPATFQLPTARTVGWLLERTPERVTVGAEWFDDGTFRDVTSIPAAMVQRVRRIG